MKRRLFFNIACFISLLVLLTTSCKKEYSYEGGNAPLLAQGSLLDSLGNCQAIIVSGNYEPNSTFTNNNYISVMTNITRAGSYNIYTDTVNGFYFTASGVVNVGVQAIQLKAYGAAALPVAANFTIHFNESICNFTIMPDSAIFNFGSNCGAAIVKGMYTIAAPLDASNTVNLLVTVTSPGPFKIQTIPVNGMLFSATGNFSRTGNYLVTLIGSGTPVAAGNTTISIAGTDCSFQVEVNDITTSDLFWQYTADGIMRKGMLDSAIQSTSINNLYPANTIYGLQDYGRPYGPPGTTITFQLNISRINQILSAGSYTPAFLGSRDLTGGIEHFDTTGNLSSSNSQTSFTIIVTTYNAAIRLVEGTFSGPVIDEFGQTHAMTNGAFRTYFKK